jgi:hypothetical protein
MKLLAICLLALAPSIAHADKNYIGGKGASWDCKKDPVVNINHGKGKYTFTGACKEVNVNGGENTIAIASTAALHLTGGKNKITIGDVDDINVVGADNVITYKKGVTGDAPKVSQIGDGNKISKAK